MNPVTVSIIIAVFNNQQDIEMAMQSVCNQTFENWELIVVDDCSTDLTQFKISEFCLKNEKRDKIKCFRNLKNCGTYVSFNGGIQAAQGEYVKFLGSDDWIHPEMMKEQWVECKLNPQAVGCLTSYARDSKVFEKGEATIMFVKRIIDEIGYFDSVRFAADSEFIGRILAKYGETSLCSISKVLYYAKRRPDSLTAKSSSCGFYKSGPGADIRRIYRQKYMEWHNQGDLYMPYPLDTRPFPCHPSMMP